LGVGFRGLGFGIKGFGLQVSGFGLRVHTNPAQTTGMRGRGETGVGAHKKRPNPLEPP